MMIVVELEKILCGYHYDAFYLSLSLFRSKKRLKTKVPFNDADAPIRSFSSQTDLKEVLPEAGMVYSEIGSLTEVLYTLISKTIVNPSFRFAEET